MYEIRKVRKVELYHVREKDTKDILESFDTKKDALEYLKKLVNKPVEKTVSATRFENSKIKKKADELVKV